MIDHTLNVTNIHDAVVEHFHDDLLYKRFDPFVAYESLISNEDVDPDLQFYVDNNLIHITMTQRNLVHILKKVKTKPSLAFTLMQEVSLKTLIG